MKDERQRLASTTRRRFLKGVATAGGTGAVLASTPAVVLAQGDEAGADDRPEEGYRLTAHILKYYKTAAS